MEKGKTLFLKWLLLNAATVVLLSVLGLQFHNRIHGATLVAIPLILLYFAYANISAGRICWQADRVTPGSRAADRLLHEAKWLEHWAWNAQIVGILSTLAGFWILLSGGSDAALHDRILNGGGLALAGTFVGVLISKVLKHEQRMIEHELEG